jgi:hypothetical protein
MRAHQGGGFNSADDHPHDGFAAPAARYDHWLRDLVHNMADTFAPAIAWPSCSRRVGAPRATASAAPVVLADAGVENVNAQVDELITTVT